MTLVFTDIEGSTQLLRALGGQYSTLLADHHRLLGEAFREHDGTEQETAGDGLHFTFASARAAVLGAVAAQRALGRQGSRSGILPNAVHGGQCRPPHRDVKKVRVDRSV